MKLLLGLAAVALLLLPVSCNQEKFSDETIAFYNFSPATVTKLEVYDSKDAPGSSRYNPLYEKKDLLYTYTGNIKTGTYDIFEIPSDGHHIFIDVTTEEGETYEGDSFFFNMTATIVFSVDYDVLEY
jgi:hypothetical protein